MVPFSLQFIYVPARHANYIFSFPCSLPPRAKGLDVCTKWHRAFHGTRHKFLNKILEVGELAVPGKDDTICLNSTGAKNLGMFSIQIKMTNVMLY